MEDRDRKKALVVFDTTNHALKTEGALKSAGIPCTVIPTPTEVSAECGIALLVDEGLVDRTRELLAASGSAGYRMIYPFG